MVYLWSFVLCGALIVQGAVSDTTYFSVVGRDGHPVKEITTNQTESVVFNCTVLSGGPVSQITWKKGSHVLRESRGSLMWLNYTISKVVEENAGLYRCIVRRNGSNGFRVSKVFLHVNVPPRLTYRTSSPLFNFMGNSRTLQCYATGRPQPSFQWKFNNTLIKNSDMGNTTLLIPKEKGLELVISSFGQQHQGRFTCEASNDLGKDASDIQSIVTYRAFEVPPKIIVAKSLVRVKLNSSSELGCKADYVPFTVILDYVMLWKFNGSILSNTVKYAVANKRKLRRVGANYAKYEVHSKLRIHEVLKEDAGSYTCHVTTYLGQDEGRVILEVTRAKSNNDRDSAAAN